MRFGALIALGLLFAAGLGLAGHLIARDTVALPVASVEAGDRLAPAQTGPTAPARRKSARKATPTTTTTTTTESTTTDDDGSGRGRGRGRGGDDSSGSSGSGSSGSGSGRDHPEDD